ncbi:ead/Ea22-like family protein [Klebsiella pneumoniae]
MTTDITELAQSLKAAAIDAKELAIIARYSKGRAAAEKFYALANPNNIIALVEALEKAQQRNEELEAQNDYFASLVAMARVSADKAIRKFPQPNYVLLKVAEEAGEVVQAGVHYAENRMEWGQVEGEIVQLLAMLIRLVTEGDQVNGITPPALCYAGIKVEAE